ncbi:thiolase family protein [Hydrogenophaga palleronii]|uniref:thiolase family protein n=1 Tax=Hydrogenophaga palleronii TaxID=65655 RepID=UPI000825525D|nr:thiolase family protein [Hydrogenophaga palleronii]
MKVGIVGVGLIPWKSRYPDKTYYELALDVTKAALADAKISPAEVDNVVYGLSDLMVAWVRQCCPATTVQDYIGMAGKPSVHVSAGAVTGAMAVRQGMIEILSGMSDVTLVVGSGKGMDLYDPDTQKRSTAFLKAIMLDLDTTWEVPVEPLAAANFAFVVQSHIDRFGAPTEEQMAKVSVKNHGNALSNPLAQSGLDLTVEDVMKSRRVAGPIKFYDCCLYSEGAAALVLASEERARQLSPNPIWIEGVGSSNRRSYMPDHDELGRLVCQHIGAQRAYQMAGIRNPMAELDFIETHDLLSGIELISYAELGLCAPGDGGRLIDEGVTLKSGALPVNPSGGMIGCGHVAGCSGISRIGEITRQLRGEAGGTQVPIRNGKALFSAIGGPAISQSCSIVLGVS